MAQAISPNRKLFSVADCAEIGGMSRDTIYRNITNGKLKARKVGDSTRVKKEDMEEFFGIEWGKD